jgi:membrane protease YdiL (CAAX protease family)
MFKRRELPEFLNVPWTIRDVFVYAGLWIGLQVLLLLGLQSLGTVWVSAAQFMQAVYSGDVAASFALNVADAAIGFGLVGLFLRRYQVGWSTAGWRRINVLKTFLYIVGILVAFVILANVLLAIVAALVPGFDPNQAQENDFTGEGAQNYRSMAVVALVLIPPFLEETIFRGFLFPALAKRTGVVWGAILSSVVFGLAHGQANIGVYTFVLGLLLCFLYVRTKSIIPGIMLHMVNNFLAFLALTSAT